jgi:hypothetical protein
LLLGLVLGEYGNKIGWYRRAQFEVERELLEIVELHSLVLSSKLPLAIRNA